MRYRLCLVPGAVVGKIYNGKGKSWVSGAGLEWKRDVEPWLRLSSGEAGDAGEGTLQLTSWSQGVALYVLRRGTLWGLVVSEMLGGLLREGEI